MSNTNTNTTKPHGKACRPGYHMEIDHKASKEHGVRMIKWVPDSAQPIGKHANPFNTINEALNAIKSLGLKPEENPFKYDETSVHWQECILSVTTNRIYEGTTYYFDFEVHLTSEGFDALVKLIEPSVEVVRVPFSDCFDEVMIKTDPLLRIYKLEPRIFEVDK